MGSGLGGCGLVGCGLASAGLLHLLKNMVLLFSSVGVKGSRFHCWTHIFSPEVFSKRRVSWVRSGHPKGGLDWLSPLESR